MRPKTNLPTFGDTSSTKQGSLKDTFCPFETWLFPPAKPTAGKRLMLTGFSSSGFNMVLPTSASTKNHMATGQDPNRTPSGTIGFDRPYDSGPYGSQIPASGLSQRCLEGQLSPRRQWPSAWERQCASGAERFGPGLWPFGPFGRDVGGRKPDSLIFQCPLGEKNNF